jgi:PAS domain S-box-containing protein
MRRYADSFLHHLADGVLLLRDFRVVYANPAAAALLGRDTASLLVGEDVPGVVAPADVPVVQDRLRAVLESGVPSTPRVNRFLEPDGREVEAEARTARVEVDGGPGLIVLLRDVAERRAAERAREGSERRLARVLETLEEGVVVQDGTLAIRLWNPAALRILGLTEDQITGRTSYDPRWRATDAEGATLPGDQHPGAIAVRTGARARAVMRIERPDGSHRWLQVQAVPLEEAGEHRVLASFVDVTELHRATEVADARAAQLRFVADHAIDMISVRDAEGRFLYANAAHETVLGLSPDSLLGQGGHLYIHPDDLAAQRQGLQRVTRDGRAARVVLRLRHADGTWRTVESEASPLLGRGAEGRFVVVARDMSARSAAEADARQRERFAALGRLAAGAAHDFNNLLTVIRLETDALGRGESAASQRIAATIDRAVQITTELLAFSQGRHAEPGRLALDRWLASTNGQLADGAALPPGWHASVLDGARGISIAADADQLLEALTALLRNAKESGSSPAGITLLVDTVTLDPDPPAASALPAGRYVAFVVGDLGRGMSAEVQRQAVDPYFTTKPPGIGAGLGLSKAYGVAKQHGGTVWIDSEPGAGTRVTMLWPVSDDAIAPEGVAPEGAVTASSPEARPARVLLVDDEPNVRAVMARALEALGHEVTEAADAHTALRLAEAGTFDALVTDVRMPEMSGVELVSALIEANRAMPVVLVSGQLDVDLPRTWPAALHHRFLQKPFGARALAAALDEVLRRSPVG